MEKFIEFKCQGDNLEDIPESIVLKTGLTFPKAHTNKEDLVLLAKEMKNHKKDCMSRVPFCVTVEAEALGAKIKLGDMKVGPRVDAYSYNTIEELQALKEINLETGRIKEVLASVAILKAQGETAVLSVEGPFTIIASLIDPMVFYKAIKKDKQSVEKILKNIEDSLVKYIIEGLNRGAKIISYGDPVGALDIVGPKVFKEFSGKTSYNILKKVEPYLEHSIIHLCGKTSMAFQNTGYSQLEVISFKEDITYGEAILKLLEERKEVKFIGNSCIKRTSLKMANSSLWQIKLLDS